MSVVHRGIDLIGDLLARRAGVSGLMWFAVGSGQPEWDAAPPTPSPTATRLNNEMARFPLGPSNFTLDPAKRTIDIQIDTPATGAFPLREFGVFGGNASALPGTGYLFSYRIHPLLPVPATGVAHRELTLTFNLPNLLDSAWQVIAGLLTGDSKVKGVTDWAEGSGDPSFDAAPPAFNAQTKALKAEVFRRPLHAGGDVYYDPPSHTLVARTELAYADAAAQLRETGLFSGASLVGYQTYPVIDKRQPKILRREFLLELSGDHTVAMPDLANTALLAAQASLTTAGLVADPITRVEDDAHVGQVISFSPAAGTVVPAGSRASVTAGVASLIEVPNVLGLSPQDAAAVLSTRTFTVGDGGQDIVPEGAIPGGILRQNPRAGARIASGAAVALTLGLPRNVTTPALIGLTPAQAGPTLEAAALKLKAGPWTAQESDAETGSIIVQNPAAGTQALRWSEVDITLASLRTIVVPDISGKSVTDAVPVLQAAADSIGAALGRSFPIPLLAIGEQGKQVSSAAPGTIVGQDPAANTRVAWFTTIRVLLAEPATVLAPALVGLSLDDAKAQLAALKLVPGTITNVPSSAAVNSVLAQSQPAGTGIFVGSAIALSVAVPVTVIVPNIVNISLAAATEVLQARALVLGIPVPAAATVPEGTIVAQNPLAGSQVNSGTSVVPTAVVKVDIPNLVGMSTEQAVLTINAALLRATVAAGPLSDQPVGRVLSQNPAPPARVVAGSNITITTALGVNVPSMTGLPIGTFPAQLAGLQLSLQLTTTLSSLPVGNVISQSPAGGTMVPIRSTVQVVQAAGVPVPNVAGKTADAATAVLVGAGFSVAVNGLAGGVVGSQVPAAGQVVPVGIGVTITLALPAGMVSVPNVVGQDEPSAVGILNTFHLVGHATLVLSGAAPGVVVAQNPRVGTTAAVGSGVQLMVSRGNKIPPPLPQLRETLNPALFKLK